MPFAILAAATLVCHAPLPEGGETAFRLSLRHGVLVQDMGGGNVHRMPLVEMPPSNPPTLAGSIRAGRMLTSLLIDERGRFQQTFILPGSPPMFVYGACRRPR